MKTIAKIGLLVLFGLVLAIAGYTAYTFFVLIWFLLPTGVLLAAMFLAPVLQATPLKLADAQKQDLAKNTAPQKASLPRAVWIFWSLAASIFITFFNGFTGNVVWCLLTLILLTIEIRLKKKQLAIKELKPCVVSVI